MRGLKIQSTRALDLIMGANELKDILSKTSINDFVGDHAWINLHTHSNASDGTQSPEQWIENAYQWKQSHHLQNYIIALTDHDTLDGLIPLLKIIIKNHKKYAGLRVILGCELSTSFESDQLRRPLDFEILHYGINPFDMEYKKILKQQADARHKALPVIFQFLNKKYPWVHADIKEYYKSKFYTRAMQLGIGVNWLYNTMAYFRSITSSETDLSNILDDMMDFGFQEKNNKVWWLSTDLLAYIKKHGGFASMAHPYRLQLGQKINSDVNIFIPSFFTTLHKNGMEATELFYGKMRQMQASFDILQMNKKPQNETDYWVKLIEESSQKIFPYATGGSDNHGSFLGNFQFEEKENAWQQLLSYWHQIQPLIQTGYHLLDKEVTMGLPGPCMPAYDLNFDIGIGSPYGKGANRVWEFWGKTIHKILLGPSGRTFKEAKHSPYVSDDEHPNPYFIPVEFFIENHIPLTKQLSFNLKTKTDTEIDFDCVQSTFKKLTSYLHFDEKQIDFLASKFKKESVYPYIADLQVCLSKNLCQKYPDLFLQDFTLGTPADTISDSPRNWGFPVFNPEKLWSAKGLGPAGKLWQHIIDQAVCGAKGGLRIDHFIGMVNPYVISTNPHLPNGRLYSSYEHPILKKFALTKQEEFYKVIDKIILPVLKKHHLSCADLYPEDIGARPEQLDDVLNHFGLGRLIVAQFNNPNDPHHMYNLMNTSPSDVATLDTHDTPSIQMFFNSLDDAGRYAYAQSLAKSLRFNYTDDLKSTQQLIRMQWGVLLTCPAKRIQAFFTSWTGQIGRYNEPGNPDKWRLRCSAHFGELYFKNLHTGFAYNPLDAIALAIYARGDAVYQKNKDFVAQLREAESHLNALIYQWLNA